MLAIFLVIPLLLVPKAKDDLSNRLQELRTLEFKENGINPIEDYKLNPNDYTIDKIDELKVVISELDGQIEYWKRLAGNKEVTIQFKEKASTFASIN